MTNDEIAHHILNGADPVTVRQTILYRPSTAFRGELADRSPEDVAESILDILTALAELIDPRRTADAWTRAHGLLQRCLFPAPNV